MSAHNICFYGVLEKIIPELSPATPPLQVCYPIILQETVKALIRLHVCMHRLIWAFFVCILYPQKGQFSYDIAQIIILTLLMLNKLR